MEKKASEYFGEPIDKNFVELCGEKKYDKIVPMEIEEKSTILKESIEKNEDKKNDNEEKKITKKQRKKYIEQIKKLMKESGLDKKYIFGKKKEYQRIDNYSYNHSGKNDKYQWGEDSKHQHAHDINKNYRKNNKIYNPLVDNQDKTNIEKKNNLHKQVSVNVKEWLKKINLLPFDDDINTQNKMTSNLYTNNDNTQNNIYDDTTQKGVVKFIGMKGNDIYKYFIYLREENIFNPFTEGKIYKWGIKFGCTSHLLGVGLAEKEIVEKNNYQFLRDDDNFYNGVFCMINTYCKDNKTNEVRPWNCNDKNLVNYVSSFQQFKIGITINISYNCKDKKLIFRYRGCEYTFSDIIPKGSNQNGAFVPCVIFYYPGDSVIFGNLEVEEI